RFFWYFLSFATFRFVNILNECCVHKHTYKINRQAGSLRSSFPYIKTYKNAISPLKFEGLRQDWCRRYSRATDILSLAA
ncbi:unnamed protein product, partial [Haemonchus placei]|uniref:Secreted protein n=1 Tax=Haemonchus placei TaxID=6290 RepID=A0A0N4W509_HAEPC